MGLKTAIIQLVHRGKNHSNLETNARFRGSQLYATALIYQGAESSVKRDRVRALAREKLLDGIASARVGHVAIDELPPALGTSPERARSCGRRSIGHRLAGRAGRLDELPHTQLNIAQRRVKGGHERRQVRHFKIARSHLVSRAFAVRGRR